MRHAHLPDPSLRDLAPRELVRDWLQHDDAILEAAITRSLAAVPAAGLVAHPLDVTATLATLRSGRDSLIGALLVAPLRAGQSDTKELERHFPTTAVQLATSVAALIERRFETSDERPDQTERLRLMLLSMVEDTRAIPIKIAYRLQHLRMVAVSDDLESCRPLARETLDVIAPLANRLGLGSLKWELEDLSFRILDPDAYRAIAGSLDANRSEREAYVAAFVSALETLLAREAIDATVFGRPKHIYSIWRKMQKKARAIDTLFDLRATRVIVADIATCYRALGTIHEAYRHLDSEFDDYVANPKPNGYQSVHTAVIGPEGKVVEVQIRTRAMDDFAELGVAAHWAYKEGGREDLALQQSVHALRQLLEGEADDQQILEHLQTGALFQRVFVLTPAGDVLDLIRGSTPLDFAYAVHTDLGHRCRGAKVDGRIVPLAYRLRSGERVEILTASEARPSRDWMNPHLGYLASARARHKVRSWFRQQDQEQHLTDGRALLERELHRLGLQHLAHDQCARLAGFEDARGLMIALGAGDLTPAQLIGRIGPTRPQRARSAPSAPQAGIDAIRIRGVGGLLVGLASCCDPQPGDPIVGYITRGAGVRVHRADCSNVLHFDDEQRKRLIGVSWGDEPETQIAELELEAHDRSGLLRDVTAILAREHINLIEVRTRTLPSDRSVQMHLTAEFERLEQLQRALDRIDALANVQTIRRRRDVGP